MKSNVPKHLDPIFTHEGAKAVHITPIKELRRSCLTALLFENLFYESGSDHAKRVKDLIPKCKPEDVAALAIECRNHMYLRHMPLFLARELARVKGNGTLVAAVLENVIQRPDELGEYLALYWKDKKEPISAGSKRGLARAFKKFNAEQLSKYDQDNAIKLRDVMRLVHAKPQDREQSETWKLMIKRELPTAKTWETLLSAGGDKLEVFETLLREKKLGGLAFLRNLRNMINAGVSDDLIRQRFEGGFKYVLPFRFIASLKYAPQYLRELDGAMQRSLVGVAKLPGKTGILIDVSGSMGDKISQKSELTRLDVAAGLGVLVASLTEKARVFTFSNSVVEVPPYSNLALVGAIRSSQPHLNTYLGRALQTVNEQVELDRLIVITDEQSHDKVGEAVAPLAYMINVASFKPGVGYGGKWIHIDGWSEKIMTFISEYEADLYGFDRVALGDDSGEEA